MSTFLAWLVVGGVISQPLNSGNVCSSGIDHELKMFEDIRRRLILNEETQRRHDSDIADLKQRLTQKDSEITDINNRHDADIDQLQQSMANMAGPTESGTGMNV
jgi:hypothetical protein